MNTAGIGLWVSAYL